MVYVWHRSGELLRKLKHGGRAQTVLRFSSDCRRLAAAGEDMAYRVWDLKTGRLERTVPITGADATVPAFSRDLRMVAFTGSGGALQVQMDGGTTKLGQNSRSARLLERHLAFSHDGSLLAAADRVSEGFGTVEARIRRRIHIWDLSKRRIVQEISCGGQNVQSVEFDPARMLYVCDGSEIRRWNVDAGRETWRFSYKEWIRSRPSQIYGRATVPTSAAPLAIVRLPSAGE